MSPNNKSEHVPVLIIGGGVVGLSAALFLNHHGIETILIEKHQGTSIHPRSRSVNARTMELYRELNIATAIQEAGKEMAPTMGVITGRSLYSAISPKPRLQSTTGASRPLPFASLVSTLAPVLGQFILLEKLEPLLLSTLHDRGVTTRFSTECLSITQSSSEVIAKLRNRQTGEEYQLTADYCIAADGANSPIRTQLNIKRSDQYPNAGHLLNIYFRAPLRELVANREFSLANIHRKASFSGERDIDGLIASINQSDRWVFHLNYDPSAGEKPSDFTYERCASIVSKALGMEDSETGPVEIEIISVLPWQASVRIAERMQEGRIFLAGDSAHQMPPYAGQGANTGIADAHNLAWKLAAVLKSGANPTDETSKRVSPALLETYEKERLPTDTYAGLVSGASTDDKGMFSLTPNFKTAKSFIQRLFIIAGLNAWYQGPGIDVISENPGWLRGASWRAWSFSGLVMGIDGMPGRRAPHIWLKKPSKLGEGKGVKQTQEEKESRISTLDLFGRDFVLLTGSEGRPWVNAAQTVSLKGLPTGVEIRTYVIGGEEEEDYVPVDGRTAFETAAGIASTGALLVRPDGFVAWRERRIPSECEERLEDVMRRLLFLTRNGRSSGVLL
ncbi:hypothetical protein VTL71DRAFT_12939 [Oculimacula yallundae]|uniref:FAD-binding domain-containing protein n=1 Tax=Oculimacula yallundae TaxID=86028 RepID=A0ABR4CRK4_9HELO